MSTAALVPLTWLLLLLMGAIGHLLQLEMMKPDLALVLVVFLALERGSEVLPVVLLVGFLADSAGGTPPGMTVLLLGFVWLMVRLARRILQPERLAVRFGLLAAGSAVSLLVGAQVMSMMAGGRSEIVLRCLVFAVPVTLLNMACALVVWPVARRVIGPVLPHSA